jgi:hypothetical protein
VYLFKSLPTEELGNFLEIRAGAGGPVCFLRTWQPFVPSAGTQDFFLTALVGGGKKTRKGKGKEKKIKQSKKEKKKQKRNGRTMYQCKFVGIYV